MIPPRILVIDDQFANEPDLRGNLCITNGLVPIEVTTSDSKLLEQCKEDNAHAGAVFESGQLKRGEYVENSVTQVLKTVESGWPHRSGWRWALILLDLHFASWPPRHDEDNQFGLTILEQLVRRWPDPDARIGNSEVPIVMLSSEPRHKNQDDPGRIGALAYVEKPELTRQRLKELLNEHGLIGDVSGKLKGNSYRLLRVLRDARKVAQLSNGNALILGPQGSGKSSLALYIHEQSRASTAPFIRFFSSPGASQLEYANLFGCWKGAHNQADESSGGAAEKAHEGTLLIDEVHNLTGDNQQELLQFGRLDQSGKRWLRRLGIFPTAPEAAVRQALKSVRGELDSNKSLIAVDVLLLSATNEPLDDSQWRLANGFSEPLYTRLALEYAGKPLRFPSLNERREDIPELFESFLKRETERIGGRIQPDGTKSVDDEVKGRLQEYHWPGNVAEMEGIARSTARNSRDFTGVFLRHLPSFPNEAPDRPVIIPPTPLPLRPAGTLDDLEEFMRTVPVPRQLSELNGRLASLQDAYGELVKRILETTLSEMKESRGGKSFVTPALSRLFPGEITLAYQAYRKLLSLSKLFKKNPPASGSLLEYALTKASGSKGREDIE